MRVLIITILILTSAITFGQNYSCQHFKQGFYNNQKNVSIDNRTDTIDITNYHIVIDSTNITNQYISANCTVNFKSKLDTVTHINLDLLLLNVDSVHYKGLNTPFSYNDTTLSISFLDTLFINDSATVTVYYDGNPKQDPNGLGGFYFQGNTIYNIGVTVTTSPHNFGKVWHPCFDNFKERATYHFSITTDTTVSAFCNGLKINQQITGNIKLTEWKIDQAIPSYLAGMAISNYVDLKWNHVSQLTGDTVPVLIAAWANDTNNIKASFINLNNAFDAYENAYGTYYWDRIGYVMTPFTSGAMEHPTNIVYPNLAANGTLAFESLLMAHELAHHWWGDMVTTEDAKEMWINEGMAKYSEFLFDEKIYNYDKYIKGIRDNHYDVLQGSHLIDSGYYALNNVPEQFTYGETTYNKGADVVHSLRGYLGDSLFFLGLKNVLDSAKGKTLNSFQYRDYLNNSLNTDVSDFFNDWVYSLGFSDFDIDSVQIIDNGNGTFDFNFRVFQQLREAPNYFNNVPLQLTIVDSNWNKNQFNILVSGQSTQFNITLPFYPNNFFLNENEKINYATTGTDTTIRNNTTMNIPYSNISSIVVSNIVDSVILRVEQHWVVPIGNAPSNIILSKDRYWNFFGQKNNNTKVSFRLIFDARQTSVSTFMDEQLMNFIGTSFVEDSLVLLFKPFNSNNWQIDTTYTMNVLGSNTNGHTFFLIDSLQFGKYTFGYKSTITSVQEQVKENTFKVYPNPVSETLVVIANNNEQYNYTIYNITGTKIKEGQFQSKSQVDVKKLSNGIYFLQLTNNNNAETIKFIKN